MRTGDLRASAKSAFISGEAGCRPCSRLRREHARDLHATSVIAHVSTAALIVSLPGPSRSPASTTPYPREADRLDSEVQPSHNGDGNDDNLGGLPRCEICRMLASPANSARAWSTAVLAGSTGARLNS